MSKPIRLAFDDGLLVRVTPEIHLKNTVKANPGDLAQFTPQGNGVYGYQNGNSWNPFTGAPQHEAHGGVVYFSGGIPKEDFEALMRVMGVQPGYVRVPSKNYAAFMEEAETPGRDGYLTQLRLVSKFGLRFMFDALDEAGYESFPEQEFTMVEAMWAFIEHERKRWNGEGTYSKTLDGLFGGDGDFARESLSFGFMLENDYHKVCRIWSRAWLVTK